MKNWQKWISLLLVAVTVMECSPINALAESAGMITAEELSAAWALTGMDENAAGYREGMAYSSTMNASQISNWLNELLENEIASLQQLNSELENNFDDMKRQSPALYTQMTTGSNADYHQLLLDDYSEAETMRQRLRYYRDKLDEAGNLIFNYKEYFTNSGDYTRSELLTASYRIREAAQTIRDIRDEIAAHPEWTADVDRLLNHLTGSAAGNSLLRKASGYADWLHSIRNWNPEERQPITATVSASTLYPSNGKSLLARLSPISSALADASETVTVTVLGANEIAFEIRDPNDQPFENAAVKVSKVGDSTIFDEGRTDKFGCFITDANVFCPDEKQRVHVRVEVTADNYQPFLVEDLKIRKGSKQAYSLEYLPGGSSVRSLEAPTASSDGAPFVYSASFDGKDILKSEFQAYYSEANDKNFTLKIQTLIPSTVHIFYNCTEKDLFDPKLLSSVSKYSFETVKTLDTDAYATGTWTDMLKSKLMPGKRLFVSFTDSPKDESDIKELKLTMVNSIFKNPVEDVQSLFIDDMELGKFLGMEHHESGFGLSFPIPTDKVPEPITGMNAGVSFPFLDFSISGVVDVGGGFIVFIGGVPSKWQDRMPGSHDWREDNPEDTAETQNDAQDDGSEAARQSEQNGPQDGQTKRTTFFGGWKMSIKFFGIFTGQFEFTNKFPDKGKWDLKNRDYTGSLSGGMMLNFAASLSWSPLPWLTFTLEFSVGLTVGSTFGWYQKVDVKTEKRVGHFDFETSGITIIVRLQITISVTVGVKHIFELTLGGYGYIKIVFKLGATFGIAIFGGFGLFVRVEFLYIFSFEMTLWDSGDILLYQKDTKSQLKSMRGVKPWYEALLATAYAQEEPEPEQAGTPTTPEDYAALTPNTTVIASGLTLDSPDVRFVEVNGALFAIYISNSRVTWRNLNTGRTGTLDYKYDGASVFDYGAFPYEYSFDAQVMRCDTQWDVPPRQYQDMIVYADENKGFYKDRDLLLVAVAATSGFTETAMEGQTETVKTPNDTRLRYAVLALDGDGLSNLLAYKFPKGMIHSSPWGQVCGEIALDRPMGNVTLCLDQRVPQDNPVPILFGYIVADDAVGAKMEIDHAEYWTIRGILFNTGIVTTNKTVILDQSPGSGSPWSQLIIGDVPEPYYSLGASFNSKYTYVINGGKLERWNNDNQSVLPLADENVAFFQLMQNLTDTTQRTVFYLEKEIKGDDNDADDRQVTYHVKAAALDFTINYHNMQEDLNVTSLDLDVTIPTNAFRLQRIGNSMYLYWLELAPKDESTDPDIYRLRGLVYDQDAMITSDDFILAQFEPAKKSGTPANIYLSSDYKGYYTVWNSDGSGGDSTATIYSFPFQLIPHIDLTGLVVKDGVVFSGADMDAYLTLMNDGNANIDTIDLEVVLEDDDGHVVKNPDGTDMIVETLHANLLDPDQSKRVIYVGGEKIDTGAFTIYRQAESPDAPVQSTFHVTKQTTSYRDVFSTKYTDYSVGGATTNTAVSEHLLPRQKATFVLSIHIPADWSRTKHITVRLAETQRKGLRSANGGIVTYGIDSVRMDHSLHDIDVKARVYPGPGGEDYLSISLYNHAETEEGVKLYAELYLDGADTPEYLDLPYFPDYISHDAAQTITMPVSTLLGGRSAHKARVVIRGAGIEERSYADNEFTLYLTDESNPLCFTLQPTGQTALEGADAEFFVAVSGGNPPYACQWQEYLGQDLGWTDIANATGNTLKVEAVKLSMNGRQYRCVVTDHNLDEITSDPAVLNVVSSLPPTGDHTSLPLYLTLAAAALLLAAVTRYVRKKRE